MIYFDHLADHGGIKAITFYQNSSHYGAPPENEPFVFLENHSQVYLELISLISGELHVNIKDKTHVLHRGDLAIINPNEPHSGYVAVGKREAVYFCTIISLGDFMSTLPGKERELLEQIECGKRSFANYVKSELAEPISKLIIEHNKAYWTYDNLGLCILTYRIIGELLRSFLIDIEAVASKNDVFVRTIENFVELNYMRPLKSVELANLTGYSESHFCRLFKQLFILTFKDYLVEYRLRRATELFGENKSMLDIASEVGFKNYGYFSVEFKKRYGIPPSEYAAKIQVEKDTNNK